MQPDNSLEQATPHVEKIDVKVQPKNPEKDFKKESAMFTSSSNNIARELGNISKDNSGVDLGDEQKEMGALMAEMDRLTRETEKELGIEEETKSSQDRDTKLEEISPQTKGIMESLRVSGIDARVMFLTDSGPMTEAIILQKKEQPTEKMVRIYRGIAQPETTVLQQLPYAMRVEGDTGPKILEDVRQEVDILAHEPTYAHFLAYVDKIKPQLSVDEQRRLDGELKQFEDGILAGYSTRTELMYAQFGHNGGVIDTGFSPYLSASWSPKEALGYARGYGALLVIDIPISQVEDLGSDNGETCIKGALDLNNITAIIPRHNLNIQDLNSDKFITSALDAVSKVVDIPIYNSSETKTIRSDQVASNKQKDQSQREIDVQAIRERRVVVLGNQFKELALDNQAIRQIATETGTDIYTITKNNIFDNYSERLSKIGRNGKSPQEYDYEGELGERIMFDKANITDQGLFELRNLTERLERRELERANTS
ncbi:MAG: hypothetical protein COX79_02935 [Candidatus Levybacteria bacterium CG_4_10_14_0_2_um_filter_36_16]|nr:MAG: hypothetical protein AUK12_01155 [Candidatus Levybacteria bacterium CG2_30_37_29]PIR79590.1 MAG: hypothetical protein COU26_00355 [Candidatus Levybacteria bacterium CG10_big_fil_rev_8_21_14_0_10_36_30]PIZ97280.1 MAG: hypothetical protein COX79_02935 [Candidatus Levybacteria bacterium CG_4_10_14_0_2_um_filter_36_16]PJA90940.1 MAG: hypothetical protein CO136_00035 [Candidatus Levybacteria bacterium CG_4_9_14_3_um_filter_36_7]